MKKQLAILVMMACTLFVHAENWDYIKTSGEYFYGESFGKTIDEADQGALAALVSQISVHVSSEHSIVYDGTTNNGNLSYNQYINDCVKTYSSSTLTNCERMVIGQEPKVTVRRWMKKDELIKVFELRKQKARYMVETADEALTRNKVGMALQYYYWAYSLVRSVQFPEEVKNTEGKALIDYLPLKIRSVLENIKVEFVGKEGEDVDFFFTYQGKPVADLEFTYSDGRDECYGKAKDGRGSIQLIPEFSAEYYHMNIEFEYKGLARGDSEMESVLNVVDKPVFPEVNHTIKAQSEKSSVSPQTKTTGSGENTSIKIKPSETQLVPEDEKYAVVLDKVLNAIKNHRYSDTQGCFTLDGQEIFNELIGYGKGRIVGTPDIHIFKGSNGTAVARGVQMSFNFKSGTKTTFVEDVVFTFNEKYKIDNIAFGLGEATENDILTRHAPGWKNEEREILTEFLENYKTAYCLKRLDYIRSIFDDNAIIIVGRVANKFTTNRNVNENMSMRGQKIISYNRYDKETYLKNLERCFKNNEFINIRFTESDFQKMEKENNKSVYCVQLGQDYNSSSYGDQGYLFLMIDMADLNNPFIKVRTWQPNYVPFDQIYNAGDFWDE